MEQREVKGVIDEFGTYIRKAREDMPEVVSSFFRLLGSVHKEGALSIKHKELISTAISLYARCVPCMVLHTKEALNVGATKEEIMEACAVSISMGGAPTLSYIQNVMKTIEFFSRT